MSEDFRVVAFELTSNAEVELHEQQELEHLAKRKAIDKDLPMYNLKLSEYLSQFQPQQQEGFRAKQKKLKKELEKMGELNKIDCMAILNNKFANEAELLLKVPNCQHISTKDRKAILESQS